VFRIERSDSPREVREWRVLDETRDTELRFLRGIGSIEYDLFRLTSKRRVIPILTETSRQPKPAGSIAGFIYKIRDFGQARPSKYLRDPDRVAFGGESPYRFTSPVERSELLLLAAEALLVYGGLYDGFDLPDGFFQVVTEIDGEDRAFRLSDFGYVERDAPEPTWTGNIV
jgi:hypothetical protein